MRNRKVTIGIVIALVLAVVSLGIAFAAFSTTLNITGSASVESSNWNVFLTTASNGSDPGSNGVSLNNNYTEGTVSNLSTLLTTDTFTWSADVKSPDDYIDMLFYIRNTGDYDASISISGATCSYDSEDDYYSCTGGLTCTQNGLVTEEAATVCNHLHYYFEIWGGNPESNNYSTVNLFFTVDNKWAQDGSDLPKNPVTVTATPITMTATQSSSAH